MEPVINKPDGRVLFDPRILGIAAAGILSLGFYILFALRYPIWPSLATPRASWVTLSLTSWGNLAVHLGIYLGLTFLYIASFRILAPQTRLGQSEAAAPRSNPRLVNILIISVWLMCSIALMFAAPAGESHDIFDYLFRGRMMIEYQGNPLIEPPRDYSARPFYGYLAWHNHVDTYGPMWELFSAGTSVGARFVAQALGWWDFGYPFCPKSVESCRLLVIYLSTYRFLALLLIGICGWLVSRIVRRSDPAQVSGALVTWFWFPLTLIAGAVGAHNDMLMLVFLLLAIWFLQRKQSLLAFLAILLAAHVKLIAAIWLPAIYLWIAHTNGFSAAGWRQTIKISIIGLGIGVGLSWLMYAPFSGWGSLPRMLDERSQFLANSIWYVFSRLNNEVWQLEKGLVRQITVILPTLLLAAISLLVPLWIYNIRPKRWREPVFNLDDDRRMRIACLAVSLLGLFIGSYWFQHWYVLWVAAPATLLPLSLFTERVLPWLGFGALAANLVNSFVIGGLENPLSPLMAALLAVGIIWGPALLAGWLAHHDWGKFRGT